MKTKVVKRKAKSGNYYHAIIIEIIDGVEKMVLLDNAEVALLKLSKVEVIED